MFGTGSLRLLQSGPMQAFALAGVPVKSPGNQMMEGGGEEYVCVASNALLVTHGGPHGDRVILCDSGKGEHTPNRLRLPGTENISLENSLASIGLSREGIDDYILTNGGWGHAGGVFGKDGEFLLPRARVVISRGTLRGVQDLIEKSYFARRLAAELNRLEAQERLKILAIDSPAPFQRGYSYPNELGAVVFYSSGGQGEKLHPQFWLGNRSVVYMGDLVPTSWHAQSPDRFMPRFDPEEGRRRLREEKEAALNRFAAEGSLLLFYHDPLIPAAQVISSDAPDTYKTIDLLYWPD